MTMASMTEVLETTNGLCPYQVAGEQIDPFPRYVREAPREWEGLMDYVERRVADCGQPTTEEARFLFGRFEEFDNETLEANRYYGLGLVMCGLARCLNDPTSRESITNRAAINIVQRNKNYYRGTGDMRVGLRVEDIDRDDIQAPFGNLTEQVVSNVSPVVLVIADTLSRVTSARQSALSNTCDGIERPSELDLEGITSGRVAVGAVVKSAVSATVGVIKNVLNKMYTQNGNSYDVTDLYTDPLIASIVPLENWTGLNLKRAVIGAARLRLDELSRAGLLQSLILVDGSSVTAFQRDLLGPLLPPQISPERGAPLLHAKRLTCPALQVQGLVPMMLGIVHETLVEAERRIISASQSDRRI